MHSNTEVLVHLPDIIHLSTRNWPRRMTVAFSYIDDAIKTGVVPRIPNHPQGFAEHRENEGKKRELEMADFLGDKRKRSGNTGKTTTKFTPEQDHFILEEVRMKPRHRTLHLFFEKLARNLEILRGHTGNSVRSRYRLQLENKLGYVYKTDTDDNLILDETRLRIAIPVEASQTMKRKYTAEDDYNLCCAIVDLVRENKTLVTFDTAAKTDEELLERHKYPMNEEKFLVLISFFDRFALQNPQHSLSSWRDRYRKFARPFGVQKYIEKYKFELNSKDGPLPMKNMTRRPNKMSASSNEDRLSRDIKKVLRSRAKPSFNSSQHHESMHMDPHMGVMSAPMDDSAAAAVAVANMAVASMNDKSTMLIDPNIHEVLREANAEAGLVNIHEDIRLDPSLTNVEHHQHPHLHQHLDLDHSAFNDIAIKVGGHNSSSQTYPFDCKFMDSSVNETDLFTHTFTSSDQREVLSSINEILLSSTAEDLNKVTQQLEQLGFTSRYVKHIFCVTGGDAGRLLEFFQHMFQVLEESGSRDLDQLLYLYEKDGFWTPEADEALTTGHQSSLQYMSPESINARQKFLGFE